MFLIGAVANNGVIFGDTRPTEESALQLARNLVNDGEYKNIEILDRNGFPLLALPNSIEAVAAA